MSGVEYLPPPACRVCGRNDRITVVYRRYRCERCQELHDVDGPPLVHVTTGWSTVYHLTDCCESLHNGWGKVHFPAPLVLVPVSRALETHDRCRNCHSSSPRLVDVGGR